MRETFVIRLKETCGVSPGQHVLVAASGGADSTALLCLFDEIREAFPLQISCAHVEHGIRGAASVEDMRFVEALCAQKNIPFYGWMQRPMPGHISAALKTLRGRCAMIS